MTLTHRTGHISSTSTSDPTMTMPRGPKPFQNMCDDEGYENFPSSPDRHARATSRVPMPLRDLPDPGSPIEASGVPTSPFRTLPQSPKPLRDFSDAEFLQMYSKASRYPLENLRSAPEPTQGCSENGPISMPSTRPREQTKVISSSQESINHASGTQSSAENTLEYPSLPEAESLSSTAVQDSCPADSAKEVTKPKPAALKTKDATSKMSPETMDFLIGIGLSAFLIIVLVTVLLFICNPKRDATVTYRAASMRGSHIGLQGAVHPVCQMPNSTKDLQGINSLEKQLRQCQASLSEEKNTSASLERELHLYQLDPKVQTKISSAASFLWIEQPTSTSEGGSQAGQDGTDLVRRLFEDKVATSVSIIRRENKKAWKEVLDMFASYDDNVAESCMCFGNAKVLNAQKGLLWERLRLEAEE